MVQLSLANHPANASSLAAVQSELQLGNALLVTPSIIAEYLHIITDTRRFPEALCMPEALAWMDQFLGNGESVQIIEANAQSARQSMAWIREFSLGRKRILDTDFVAALYVAGCRRILTSNPGDFQIFKVFEVIDSSISPRSVASPPVV